MNRQHGDSQIHNTPKAAAVAQGRLILVLFPQLICQSWQRHIFPPVRALASEPARVQGLIGHVQILDLNPLILVSNAA